VGGPSGVPDLFAGVMAAVSLYCGLRLVAARRWHRRIRVDVNVAHVTMGVAMAGMLVPALTTLPPGWWEAVFSCLAGWFAWRGLRFVVRGADLDGDRDLRHVSHDLTHLVMAGGMLYMYLAPSGPATPSGAMAVGALSGTRADLALVPLLFVAVLSVSAVWHLDHLSRLTAAPVAVGAAPARGGVDGAPAPAGATAGAAPLAPRLEGLCHVAMCLTMGYMLVLVL